MKRASKVKQKTCFLVSQVLCFRYTKQTCKTVAGTTFKEHFLKLHTKQTNYSRGQRSPMD